VFAEIKDDSRLLMFACLRVRMWVCLCGTDGVSEFLYSVQRLPTYSSPAASTDANTQLQ